MNSSSPWIAAVFFGLAAWFAFGDTGEPIPIPPRATVPAEALVVGPRRQILHDPPTVRIGGFEQRCSDCHRLFDSLPETPPDRKQHREIVLDHGLNDRCFNCHSSSRDRDKLVLQGTREIGFDDVVQLCAKCHGPTYRDWQRGIHGKTLGAWDRDRPEFRRLGCTECHDPHRPAFDPIAPLPGPNTLRMGEPSHVEAPENPSKESPLLRWLAPETKDHGATHPADDQATEEQS